MFGAYLAYKVRHLNHNFNEAKYITLALYNVLVLSAILLGLISSFPGQVDTVFALKTLGLSPLPCLLFFTSPLLPVWLIGSMMVVVLGGAMAGFVTMCILFVPKFWDIYVTKDWYAPALAHCVRFRSLILLCLRCLVFSVSVCLFDIAGLTIIATVKPSSSLPPL